MIEKVLFQRNIAHLSQAEGTLFGTTPIIKLIGKVGYSPGADSILNESFDPPKHLLAPLQTTYFRNLQWKNRTEQSGAPKTININQIKKGFKNWKLITSISPSNRHLGYYKLLLVADSHYKKDETKKGATKYE